MEGSDYPTLLHQHLVERQYRPETVEFIGRACRVGRVSEQAALELLQTIEADRRATDMELSIQVVGQMALATGDFGRGRSA